MVHKWKISETKWSAFDMNEVFFYRQEGSGMHIVYSTDECGRRLLGDSSILDAIFIRSLDLDAIFIWSPDGLLRSFVDMEKHV